MPFEVIPAIDLSEGRVVRVTRGDLAAKTVYADDAVAVARRWEQEGAPRLHVVDLDGAVTGEPRHREAVEEIVRAVGIPVQVAGGIRSIDAARAWVDAGADRVVLGTSALTDEAFLAGAVDVLGPRLVVAADVREGEVRVAGWLEGSGEDASSAARRLAAAGVRRLLVTDIARDGLLAGPNLGLLEEVAWAARVPVIASGGVASLDDVRAVARVEGVEGVVIGRALYTGAVDLAEAVRVAA